MICQPGGMGASTTLSADQLERRTQVVPFTRKQG
jgi:hypothetical protein